MRQTSGAKFKAKSGYFGSNSREMSGQTNSSGRDKTDSKLSVNLSHCDLETVIGKKTHNKREYRYVNCIRFPMWQMCTRYHTQ